MNNIYTLNMNHAPFNTHYLHRLSNVIHNAVREHPRTTAIRVDLHVPNYKDTGDSISCIIDMNKGLMSRFIEALDARIQIFLKNKSKNGMRVYPCHLRYAWVKEIDKDKVINHTGMWCYSSIRMPFSVSVIIRGMIITWPL